MSSVPKILVTGVTGYIGGQVLHDLLALKRYDIAALIRDEPRAQKIKHLGAKAIIGELDSPNLAAIVSEFDVVLHTASSDHPIGAERIATGLEQRVKKGSSRKPIFIHTSGIGVLMDEAMGKFAGEKIYSDDDLRGYHERPPTAWHKNVDNIVLAAGDRGLIDAIIVCPPLVWGVGEGPFNQHSSQIPGIVKAFIKSGKAYTVEKGANIWAMVNIRDLSQVYLIVLEAALRGDIPSNPRDRYYFGESDEFTQVQAAEAVGKALAARGALPSAEVSAVMLEGGDQEEIKRVVMTGLTSNTRSRAVKARKLGWKPVHGGLKEFLDDAVESVDYVLKG